ncbi:hypothetical protein OG245_00550 [Streptomyces sp. NBC_01116]|uniref:hypothetical protein n=1 Tax=Streptomyces sp. NBC_01116 TaxID=2903752 RepID=UPI00324F5B04
MWRTEDHDQALRLLADRGRVHPNEARFQILTTWGELRRGRRPDTHDLLDDWVVLAARNSDVDAQKNWGAADPPRRRRPRHRADVRASQR